MLLLELNGSFLPLLERMIEMEGDFERWRDTITIYTQPPLAHIKIRDKGGQLRIEAGVVFHMQVSICCILQQK
jgi:hypothetical protein